VLARYERYISRHVYGAGEREILGGMACPAGGTNSMSYRRTVLAEVGGFDESFPVAAGEDADLKWRVVQRGNALLYIPVKVTHRQPYTLRAFWRQQISRGIGAAHFEWRRRGCYPRPARIMGRWLKRTLSFAPDTLRLGPAFAFLRLIGGWADAWGQWVAWQRHRPRFERVRGHD